MTIYFKWLIVGFLLLPLWVAAGSPDIVLKDLEGREVNVNRYIGQGKWTVVSVWAHDCPICNSEIHHMVFFHDEHKNKDAIVLGVSVDGYANKNKAAAFIQRHSLDFPNLIAEPEQSVMAKFGAGPFIGTPTYYIFSPEGELLAKNVGPVTQEDIENFMLSTVSGGGG